MIKKKLIIFLKNLIVFPYTNLQNALSNEKFNIISICTPDHTHYEITKTILNSDNKPDLIFLKNQFVIT